VALRYSKTHKNIALDHPVSITDMTLKYELFEAEERFKRDSRRAKEKRKLLGEVRGTLLLGVLVEGEPILVRRFPDNARSSF
jgi:hypothetical protein